MNTNLFIRIVLACIGIWMLSACASNEVPSTPIPVQPEEKYIPLKVPITKAINDTDPDNRIRTVRLIVIKDNVVRANKDLGGIIIPLGQEIIQLADTVPIGHADLFIIANELPGWNLSTYSKGSSHASSEIKNKILNFSAYPIVSMSETETIPMVGVYEDIVIWEEPLTHIGRATHNGVDVLTWDVQRLYAKATLNLNCVFADLVGGAPIDLMQVSVKNMPKESYLAPLWYVKTNPTDFFNGLAISSTSYDLTPGVGFTGVYNTYIPEHRVYATENFSYISVVVNLANQTDPSTEREYKIALGDSIKTLPNDTMLWTAAHVTVSRNKWYKIDATIKSYDKTGDRDIVIYPVVVSWDDSTTVIPPYDHRDYQLFISQSEFHPTTSPYDGVITIETDYRYGWKAYTEVVTGTPDCMLNGVINPSEASPVSGPSGQLKFQYSGNPGSSIRIVVTAGSGSEKITKKITISRPNI